MSVFVKRQVGFITIGPHLLVSIGCGHHKSLKLQGTSLCVCSKVISNIDAHYDRGQRVKVPSLGSVDQALKSVC